MHVVIGGYGRVGRMLAQELTDGGHTVAVIDHDPDVFDAEDDFTGLRLVGEIFDRETLIKAGIERAEAFIACSSGDNSNVIAARVAHERFCVPRVVARIFDPERAAIYESYGIPTVSSVQWSVSRLVTLLFEPAVRCDYVFGHGELLMVEFIVPDEFADRPIGEIERDRPLRIVAVEREGTARVLGVDESIRAGDRVFISTTRDTAHELRRFLTDGEDSSCA